MTATLALRHVARAFGPAKVLVDVDVEVELSGITFVVGKSGSGKSVLCRLAVGLLKPDAGEVHLFGQRVDQLPERQLIPLRARAPYLVQGPALLDWLTLAANVALANPAAASDGRLDAALARVGLAPFATRKPPEVGPGLRKRAAIARALLLEPEVLLLDEPTTGLDREASDQVNETLEVVRAQGVGAVVVSHDYRALARLADRVVEVKEGRIGYCGAPAGFLAAHAKE